jgi:transcriptional regulator with XRE-family HTH domain
MNSSLLNQLKQRRLQLGLKQQDMYMRVGLSRQQYQRIESQGNPRLNTLKLVALGLDSELILIPKEKQQAVMQLLAESKDSSTQVETDEQTLIDNPWQGLLDD